MVQTGAPRISTQDLGDPKPVFAIQKRVLYCLKNFLCKTEHRTFENGTEMDFLKGESDSSVTKLFPKLVSLGILQGADCNNINILLPILGKLQIHYLDRHFMPQSQKCSNHLLILKILSQRFCTPWKTEEELFALNQQIDYFRNVSFQIFGPHQASTMGTSR